MPPRKWCYDTITLNGLVESFVNRIINGYKNLKHKKDKKSNNSFLKLSHSFENERMNSANSKILWKYFPPTDVDYEAMEKWNESKIYFNSSIEGLWVWVKAGNYNFPFTSLASTRKINFPRVDFHILKINFSEDLIKK